MKGSLVRRGDSWRLYADAGRDPITGKRRQRTMTLPPVNGKPVGKREAENRLRIFLADVVSDTRTDHSQAKLGALFVAYLDVLRARQKSPGTIVEAERRFHAYVPAPVANVPIGKITAYTLDQLYSHLISAGGRCRRRTKCEKVPCDHGGGSPLAAATVDRLHTDLDAAFAQAVRWGWLRDNPARRAMNLTGEPREVIPPSVTDVVTLLEHVESLGPEQATLRDFLPLIVATGARPAELCASKIGDVDFDRKTLTIRRAFTRGDGGSVKDTKTHKVRVVHLDDALLARLAERRQRLAVDALSAGVPLEDWWWFPAPTDPMRPVWPSSVSRELREQRDAVGISADLTLRNIRHWVASVLLSASSITDGEVASVDVRGTAGRLGHGPNMTLGVYGHMLAGGDAAAAQVVPLVLDRARRKAAGG